MWGECEDEDGDADDDDDRDEEDDKDEDADEDDDDEITCGTDELFSRSSDCSCCRYTWTAARVP